MTEKWNEGEAIERAVKAWRRDLSDTAREAIGPRDLFDLRNLMSEVASGARQQAQGEDREKWNVVNALLTKHGVIGEGSVPTSKRILQLVAERDEGEGPEPLPERDEARARHVATDQPIAPGIPAGQCESLFSVSSVLRARCSLAPGHGSTHRTADGKHAWMDIPIPQLAKVGAPVRVPQGTWVEYETGVYRAVLVFEERDPTGRPVVLLVREAVRDADHAFLLLEQGGVSCGRVHIRPTAIPFPTLLLPADARHVETGRWALDLGQGQQQITIGRTGETWDLDDGHQKVRALP